MQCFITVVTCGVLDVSSSGVGGLTLHFSAPTTTIGTRAIYSCSNSSYQIIGNAERTCGVNGCWSGEEPQCEGMNYVRIVKQNVITLAYDVCLQLLV